MTLQQARPELPSLQAVIANAIMKQRCRTTFLGTEPTHRLSSRALLQSFVELPLVLFFQQIVERLESDGRRGEGSLRRTVKATFRGKSCSLKRHFTGCLREIIGMAEKLAAKDPERFIWNHAWSQAKKGRNGQGGGYKRRQKLLSLQLAEGFSILTPARRERWGAWQTGWIVADHDKISSIVDGGCTLRVNRTILSPRSSGERRKTYLARTQPVASAECTSESTECTYECTSECTSKNSECTSNLCNPLMEGELENGEKRKVGANPVNPVSPVEREEPETSLSFSGSPNPTSKDKRNTLLLPEHFTATLQHRALAGQRALDLNFVLEKFKAYHRAAGTKCADWEAKFTSWLLNEKLHRTGPQPVEMVDVLEEFRKQTRRAEA